MDFSELVLYRVCLGFGLLYAVVCEDVCFSYSAVYEAVWDCYAAIYAAVSDCYAAVYTAFIIDTVMHLFMGLLEPVTQLFRRLFELVVPPFIRIFKSVMQLFFSFEAFANFMQLFMRLFKFETGAPRLFGWPSALLWGIIFMILIVNFLNYIYHYLYYIIIKIIIWIIIMLQYNLHLCSVRFRSAQYRIFGNLESIIFKGQDPTTKLMIKLSVKILSCSYQFNIFWGSPF